MIEIRRGRGRERGGSHQTYAYVCRSLFVRGLTDFFVVTWLEEGCSVFMGERKRGRKEERKKGEKKKRRKEEEEARKRERHERGEIGRVQSFCLSHTTDAMCSREKDMKEER